MKIPTILRFRNQQAYDLPHRMKMKHVVAKLLTIPDPQFLLAGVAMGVFETSVSSLF